MNKINFGTLNSANIAVDNSLDTARVLAWIAAEYSIKALKWLTSTIGATTTNR